MHPAVHARRRPGGREGRRPGEVRDREGCRRRLQGVVEEGREELHVSPHGGAADRGLRLPPAHVRRQDGGRAAVREPVHGVVGGVAAGRGQLLQEGGEEAERLAEGGDAAHAGAQPEAAGEPLKEAHPRGPQGVRQDARGRGGPRHRALPGSALGMAQDSALGEQQGPPAGGVPGGVQEDRRDGPQPGAQHGALRAGRGGAHGGRPGGHGGLQVGVRNAAPGAPSQVAADGRQGAQGLPAAAGAEGPGQQRGDETLRLLVRGVHPSGRVWPPQPGCGR